MRKNVKFIAHRGLSGHYPENTHLAFNQAWEKNCDGIELDIQVSQDGQVLAVHDPDTQRVAGKKYVIAATDYADLKALNVGAGGKGGSEQFNESIPLLAEVIRNMPGGKIVQIEIKHHINNMDAVIAEFSRLRDDIEVQIISYDIKKLQRVRRELPHLHCFLVMNQDQPPIADRIGFALANGLIGLDMDYRMASPEYVKKVLSQGLQVAHWTVNDIETAERMIAQGASFIASDFADEIKSGMMG